MAPLGPFGPAPALAAGISGGPHSLALALLARDWTAARGGSLLGLVVDHGLRAESATEALWTAAMLRRHRIPAEILTLALPGGAALQERAREARLAALLARCAALGRPWLLLGQHRMDQAETLLFRALRGSGPMGLAGMAPLRVAAGAVLLRPLLPLPPARLEATLLAAGIEPLRDPSNADPRFMRVRLRQALADPGGTGAGIAALALAAEAFAGRRALRSRAMAARLAAAVSLRPEGWARLDTARLGQDDIAHAALSGLLRLISGARHAPAAAAVAALLARGQGTLHGVRWSRGVLCREFAACAPPLPAVPGLLWDGRWQVVSVPAGLSIGALGEAAGAVARTARGGLPARVLAGLPALRSGGKLVSVPGLELGRGPGPGTGLGLGIGVRLDFAPAGGPFPSY